MELSKTITNALEIRAILLDLEFTPISYFSMIEKEYQRTLGLTPNENKENELKWDS